MLRPDEADGSLTCYGIFDQINVALVSTRNFIQKYIYIYKNLTDLCTYVDFI